MQQRAESSKQFIINAAKLDIGVKMPEVESRTQGSRPRPRTHKKSEAKAKDSLSEDRHSRGQGQECSRPRPRTKDFKMCPRERPRGLHLWKMHHKNKKTVIIMLLIKYKS